MLRLPLWSSGWVTPRVASDVNPQSWGTFPTASTQQRSAAAGPAFIDCLCTLGAAGEDWVSRRGQGAAKGILETGFGNALLVLWFTCLKKISRGRNT